MTEPSEIKVGSRVFRGVPSNLRPMNPKLDIGTVVEIGGPGLQPGSRILHIEFGRLDGGTVVILIPDYSVEVIG